MPTLLFCFFTTNAQMATSSQLHNFVEKELEKYNKSGKIDVKKALKSAFIKTNEQLHRNNRIRDDLSGTTCILVLIIGKVMHIANIGDSRAIVAKQDHANKDKLNAIALSYDQTPYRKVTMLLSVCIWSRCAPA